MEEKQYLNNEGREIYETVQKLMGEFFAKNKHVIEKAPLGIVPGIDLKAALANVQEGYKRCPKMCLTIYQSNRYILYHPRKYYAEWILTETDCDSKMFFSMRNVILAYATALANTNLESVLAKHNR